MGDKAPRVSTTPRQDTPAPAPSLPSPDPQELIGNEAMQQLIAGEQEAGPGGVRELMDTPGYDAVNFGNMARGTINSLVDAHIVDDMTDLMILSEESTGIGNRLSYGNNLIQGGWRQAAEWGGRGLTALSAANNFATMADDDFNFNSLETQLAGIDLIADGLSLVPVVGNMFGAAYGATRAIDEATGLTDWMSGANTDARDLSHQVAIEQIARETGDEQVSELVRATHQLGDYENTGAARVNEMGQDLYGMNLAQFMDPEELMEEGRRQRWDETFRELAADIDPYDPMAMAECIAATNEAVPTVDQVRENIGDQEDILEERLAEMREERERREGRGRRPRTTSSSSSGRNDSHGRSTPGGIRGTGIQQ